MDKECITEKPIWEEEKKKKQKTITENVCFLLD